MYSYNGHCTGNDKLKSSEANWSNSEIAIVGDYTSSDKMSTSYFVCAIICKLCVQYWPYGKIFQHGHLDLDLKWAGTFESNFLKTGNMGLRPVCFWALQMWSSLTCCFMLDCFSESCQLSCCFSESSSQLGFFSETLVICQKKFQKLFFVMLEQCAKRLTSGTQCKVAAVVSVWEGQDRVTYPTVQNVGRGIQCKAAAVFSVWDNSRVKTQPD